MYKKLCPKCHKASYSSYDDGKWVCPSCNHDLTHMKASTPEIRKKDRPPLFIIKKTDQPKVNPYIFKSFD